MIELTKLPVVALPCLNEDHISVAKIINDLTYRLNDEASTVSELIQRYEALLEHCENHFLCEEFQMQKYHYPALESHQKIHNEMVSEMRNVYQHWSKKYNRQLLLNYINDNFTPWLIDHIETYDEEAAQFIVDAGGT